MAQIKNREVTVSLLVVAYNEEALLPGLLDSLREHVDEMIVIDDGSTDHTAEVARQGGAVVHPSPGRVGYPEAHREYGLSKTGGDWVLLLDADERPSPALAWHLHDLCTGGVAGYTIEMRCYYDDRYTKYTRHLEHGPKQGRLFRKSALTDPGGVHRDLRVQGPTATLYPPYYLSHLKPGKWSLTKNHNAWIGEEIETTPTRGALAHTVLTILDPVRWFAGTYLARRAWLDGWPGLADSLIIARWRLLVNLGLLRKSIVEGKW